MAVAKARSFRIAESETNEVMIGAKAGDAKDVELMEAIPQKKQLTVTFSNISGWVPLMNKADPPLQKVKNMFTSKQEVHEAAKVQRKQARTLELCLFLALSFRQSVQCDRSGIADNVQAGWCMLSWGSACAYGAIRL